MQKWEDVLYKPFIASIRGEVYSFITINMLDEQCYHIACRAISAFKFPKISTAYETYFAHRNEVGDIIRTDDPEDIPHGEFVEDLTYAEIEVILGWMKVYWAEYQISNADNFEDMYTDANIKTYSRANAVEKNLKLLDNYYQRARELENRYSRINKSGRPSLGDINA